jgi:hypothetical protein
VANEHSFIVGSAVSERVHHPTNAPLGHRAASADYATNAAHEFISPFAACAVSLAAASCENRA